nr:hypothetical protein [Treponema sp.]
FGGCTYACAKADILTGNAATATNATCFGGCTYAQACANIRSGLTSCTGTVTVSNKAAANSDTPIALCTGATSVGRSTSCALTFNTCTGVLTAKTFCGALCGSLTGLVNCACIASDVTSGTTIGIENTISDGSVNIGVYTINAGVRSVAVGYCAENSCNYGVAVGFEAKNCGTIGVAVGYCATNCKSYGVAVGYCAENCKDFGVAVGHYATNCYSCSVAVGFEAKNCGTIGVAVGYCATNCKSYGVAVGYCARTNTDQGVSIGTYACTYTCCGIDIEMDIHAGSHHLYTVSWASGAVKQCDLFGVLVNLGIIGQIHHSAMGTIGTTGVVSLFIFAPAQNTAFIGYMGVNTSSSLVNCSAFASCLTTDLIDKSGYVTFLV